MSVRKLRDRVKVLRDQVAPAGRSRIVLVRTGETEDEALKRHGIDRDEGQDLLFVDLPSDVEAGF